MDVFDLHADIGFDVVQKRNQQQTDILNKYHVEKFKQGKIRYLCMACNFEGKETWTEMQEMILALNEELALCDEIDKVLHSEDLLKENGHIKAILSVEGMCGIQDDVPAKIDWLYEQGIRIGSLCWNDENALASGVRGNPNHGISDLGKEAVEQMIKHAMAIDVSHANEKTFWDLMNYQEAHILASHSNSFTLCEHVRNLNDKQLLALKKHHAIVGIVSAPMFVAKEKKDQDISHMIDQIDYISSLVGKDRVALGLDYMDFYPNCTDLHVVELDDASKTQNLIEGLKNHGWTKQEIQQVAYQNALKYMFDLFS